ncbi:Plant tudor-like RNA-binding protein [Melia azedarach]|uniref:Plant tudor-like RNA-binding protein n=1 Tax=Melia azedarach TaxID=155640 RepID=A0ACC1X9N6_MELAZ|nr:Plant tudor-like RNA-binding protein [Melia azedarach]
MRFKKGSKVEVFKSELPSGAWQCAEIISGNGHNYRVEYAHHSGRANETAVERVPRKAIRPCPPHLESVKRWMAGDVVEVFDDFSWKIATILKVLSGEYYLVRLLGSSQEFQTHKRNIRVRQSWQDGEWVVIGKGSGSSEMVKSNRISTPDFSKKINNLLVQAGENTTDFQQSHVVSARTLKRASPFVSSYAEACTGNIQKVRAIEQEGERQRVISRNPTSLLKKVDAVAYPRENLGEIYMHASSNNQTNGYYETERGKEYCDVECSYGRSSEANDSDSDICSVGSCSVISDSQIKLSSRILAGSCKDAASLRSDDESFSGRGDEEEKLPLPLGEDVAARIHRLELHAYCCTLEALYASGPLSWEQEALLTNLRITLHITNDEHLMELKNLISARTSLHMSEC